MKEKTKVTPLPTELTLVEAGIFKTLLYFDIFQYPLTLNELTRLHPVSEVCPKELAGALASMVAHGHIRQEGEFFQLAANPSWAERRKRGNALAAETFETAKKRSALVAAFPYVEAVMVSGSLSKDYMEAGSDIDFFVITRPGRLWIARTLLIAYKKLILMNSHKEFCLNYFIDTDHLEIEDKNIFTATEVAFLVPMHNSGLYRRFRNANLWADRYYPNHGLRRMDLCTDARKGWLKRTGEWFLGGSLGDWLDGSFMRLTMKRWQKKFPQLNPETFAVAMRSRKYVSKHHPSAFQERVINKLDQRQSDLEQRLGHPLPYLASGQA